mgnify:CR=1 FL=1
MPDMDETERRVRATVADIAEHEGLDHEIVDCDPEKISIGDRVRMEFRKIQEDGDAGIICNVYKVGLTPPP